MNYLLDPPFARVVRFIAEIPPGKIDFRAGTAQLDPIIELTLWIGNGAGIRSQDFVM